MSLRLDQVWKGYPTSGRQRGAGIGGRPSPFTRRRHTHWALRDITLAAEAGESIGLIGGNGSGKSTLLRLSAGLGRPTRGKIAPEPGTVAVLSLGDAFDPDLSGVENAITSTLLYGLGAAASRAAAADVIAFAELEELADAPVRVYSEGMKLRLAFGVIAQLRPTNLLVDEVLSVGDIRFQSKSLECIRRLRAGGTTLMFASHDLQQVEEECDRVIWLADGSVKSIGKPADVIGAYRNAMMSATISATPTEARDTGNQLVLRHNRFGSQELVISRVRMEPAGDSAHVAELPSGGSFRVRIDIAQDPTGAGGVAKRARLAAAIVRRDDGLKCCDFVTDVEVAGATPLSAELAIDRLELGPGEYELEVGLYGENWEYAFDLHTQAYQVRIYGEGHGAAVHSPGHRWNVRDSGP